MSGFDPAVTPSYVAIQPPWAADAYTYAPGEPSDGLVAVPAWPGDIESMPYVTPYGGLEPMPYVFPEESVAPMPQAWPSAPASTPPALEPITVEEPVERPTTGDYVGHGVKGYILPSILAGGLMGTLGASMAPSGAKAATFGVHLVGGALSGVIAGAGMGLLVAASSPRPGDDLQARYALAGAGFGAATGALFPGSISRPVSIGINAIGGAIMGYFIGRTAPGTESAEPEPQSAV